jgi:hypothetical protein
MRKMLMLMTVAALFVSCAQKKEDQGGPATDKRNHGNQPAPGLAAVLIPMASADSLIYNYNEYMKNVLRDTQSYSSFMLDAEALRTYLASNPEIVTLNIYLGKNERGKMTDTSLTLVYIGAVDSMGAGGITYNVEKPYYMPGGSKTPYFLNHSFPCPTCVDRIEAYQPPANIHIR